MNNLEKLGKQTETIGKIYFRLLLILLFIGVVMVQISKINENQGTNKIAVIVGSIIGFAIFYFISKLVFKPVYSLNKTINERINNQITENQFKRSWWTSLVCSVIVALVPIIPTFGISILVMIPQFRLLTKSKNL